MHPSSTTPWLPLARQIRQHATTIYLLVIIVSVILGGAATRITVDNSIPIWQSAGDPNWQHFQEFSAAHQLSDPLVALFPNLPYPQIKKLAQEFGQISGVDHALSFTLFTLQNHDSSLIILLPKQGSSPQTLEAIIDQIERTLAKTPEITCHIGGVWYLTAVLDKLSANSAATLFPLVLVLMAIGVWYIFKNLQKTVLVLACGALPALWLTGIMALTGAKMNMVLLALPPLTMILGVSHAIHLLLKDNPAGEEPLHIFARTLPPCLLSALTTILGFLSLCLSSYGPVQSLGRWGALGVALSLGLTILLLPGRYSTRPPQAPHSGWHALTKFLRQHPRQLLTLSLIFTIMALGTLHLSRVSFILDFLEESFPARIDHLKIEKAGLGLTPLEVDLEGVVLPSGGIYSLVSELSQNESITHFLLYFVNSPNHFKAIATANGAEFDSPLLPGQGSDTVSRVTILTKTLASEKTLALADATERLLQQRLGPRSKPYITGTVPLFTKGQEQLFTTLIRSFSLAFISISVVIGLMLRSVRLGGLAIIPNLVPVVLVLGVMGWTNIPLSVATVTVSSIVFGVVVDDTIHFLHTWQRHSNSESPIHRLHATLVHVGPAMLATSLAAGGSFLGFLGSPFLPLRNFGVLIALALMLAILCDLVLLPMLLLRAGKVKTVGDQF